MCEHTAGILSIAAVVSLALAAAALRRRVQEAREVDARFEAYRRKVLARVITGSTR